MIEKSFYRYYNLQAVREKMANPLEEYPRGRRGGLGKLIVG